MRAEYLDRVLATDEEIVPSSGLVDTVMEAVRREASRPMPIPFPWKRALPGLLLVVFLILALVFFPGPEPSLTDLTATIVPLLRTMSRLGVNWLLGVLLLAWACVKLSMQLASWGG
jgi:hypothetical protein